MDSTERTSSIFTNSVRWFWVDIGCIKHIKMSLPLIFAEMNDCVEKIDGEASSSDVNFGDVVN